MTQLRIQLFGGYSIVVRGVDLLSGRRNTRAALLLAYLLLKRGRRQRRDYLANLFWMDSSETQARTNLRRQLSLLRKQMPELAACISDDGTYLSWRMECQQTVDVYEFEAALDSIGALAEADQAAIVNALKHAISLYTGELLPAHYDDWVLGERHRLHTAYLNALSWLSQLLEASGQMQEAIHYAELLLRADRLRETSHLLLMRLYVAVGDRAQAYKVYADCARLLIDELGVGPGPAIETLHRQLLQESMRDEVATQATHHTGELVGRTAVWRELRDLWQRVVAGETQIVMLTGEPGIGKTRLMQEWSKYCGEAGALMLRAACPQAREPIAYIAPALWLAQPELTARLTQLHEEHLIYLQLLAPELRQRFPHLCSPASLTPHWQLLHLHQALSALFAGGEEPTLLFLDDAQWCDAASVEWLQYLVTTQPQARLLVVLAIRTGETVAPPLASMRTELAARGRLHVIELSRLSYLETEQLVRQYVMHMPSPQVLERLYKTSVGIPFIVVELARTLAQAADATASPGSAEEAYQLPTTISALVLHRLMGVSPAAKLVLDCAAVIGTRFASNVLHQVVMLSEDEFLQALDELCSYNLVRVVDGDDYEFGHELIREVLYEGLGVARRRQLHRRVAEAMADLYAGDLSSVGGQIAGHFEHGGRPLDAAQMLLLTAQEQSGVPVLGTALAHIGRALDLLAQASPTSATATQAFYCWLHMGTLLARHRRHDDDQVRQAFTQAHRLSKQLPDIYLRFWALRGLWTVEWGAGQLESALDTANEMHGIATGVDDAALRSEAAWAQGATLFCLGYIQAAVELLQQVTALHATDGVRSAMQLRLYATGVAAQCYLAFAELLCGDATQGLQAMHTVVALAQRQADAYTHAFVLAHLAIAHYIVHDVESVFSTASLLAAQATQHGFSNLLSIAERLQSWAFALHEDGADEVELLRQMVLDQDGVAAEMAALLFVAALAEVLDFHGREAEALATIEIGLAAVQHQHFAGAEIELHRLRGELLLRSGHNFQAGVDALEHALMLAQMQGIRLYALRAVTSLCRVWAQHGRGEEAVARLRAALAEFSAVSSLWDVRTARTLLHALTTDHL